MNRFVLVAVLGLAAVGCAAGTDDPVGDPTPVVVDKPSANKTFGGTLEPNVDERQVVTDWSKLHVGPLPNAPMPPIPMPGE